MFAFTLFEGVVGQDCLAKTPVCSRITADVVGQYTAVRRLHVDVRVHVPGLGRLSVLIVFPAPGSRAGIVVLLPSLRGEVGLVLDAAIDAAVHAAAVEAAEIARGRGTRS